MRSLFSFLLAALLAPLPVTAAGVGNIQDVGRWLYAGSLRVEFPLSAKGTKLEPFCFEHRLLRSTHVWIGGKPGAAGTRRLKPSEVAQVKMAMRRAIYAEVSFETVQAWAKTPPSEAKTPRAYWLSRLHAEVCVKGRPELTEALANSILAKPTLANAIDVLDEPDSVRPSPDSPDESVHTWADGLDEYHAVELRAYCDGQGQILRCLLSRYLIKNPPLTAEDVEKVRANGTFSAAEDVFGPDSNYTPLSRNNGAMAFWITAVDGKPSQVVVVVDRDGHLSKLAVAPVK